MLILKDDLGVVNNGLARDSWSQFQNEESFMIDVASEIKRSKDEEIRMEEVLIFVHLHVLGFK